jgi:two-component system, LytTR family, response regulator
MKQYNCLIIDDEEIDRLMVTSYVKRFPFLNIVAICSSTAEAHKVVSDNKIDVLFLDIDMPESNGLDFRKQTLHIPACIYITSHPEYALDSFELDTLDFIVKPLKFDRFSHAIKRLEDYLELKEKAELFEATIGGDSVMIKDGHNQTKVKLHDILYLEALKDYTKIITPSKKHCVLFSLGNLLKEESFKNFIRVHRSYAVQKLLVHAVNSNFVTLNDKTEIPIGRSYKDNLDSILL